MLQNNFLLKKQRPIKTLKKQNKKNCVCILNVKLIRIGDYFLTPQALSFLLSTYMNNMNNKIKTRTQYKKNQKKKKKKFFFTCLN